RGNRRRTSAEATLRGTRPALVLHRRRGDRRYSRIHARRARDPESSAIGLPPGEGGLYVAVASRVRPRQRDGVGARASFSRLAWAGRRTRVLDVARLAEKRRERGDARASRARP